MKKAFLALAVAAVGFTVGATQILAFTGPKSPDYLVGDGTHKCQNANFTGVNAINQAITASAPGKTIKVCAGSYSAVTVTKSITLNGVSPQMTTAQCITPATNPGKDVTKYSVIEGGVTVNGIDNVKVSQFTIQN